MTELTSHVDTFARDRLPTADHFPDLSAVSDLGYPEFLNAAFELVDRNLKSGRGELLALAGDGESLSYAELSSAMAKRAHLLEEHGVSRGSRVLLRSANNVDVACWWLAILRVGAIAVTTAPLLRAKELAEIISASQPTLAVVDSRLSGDWLAVAPPGTPTWLIGPTQDHHVTDGLARLSATHTASNTRADDIAIIAFTSGSTGGPKATAHFHRDLLAIADCYALDVLNPDQKDVFIGSPPLAFTFGLGGLLIFPLRFGGTGVLLESANPEALLGAISQHQATRLFTAPTAYRAMMEKVTPQGISSLRSCVSAGEPLPADTMKRWFEHTGLEIIDGIGSTEMLHIFISNRPGNTRPGSTGTAVRGYTAKIVNENMQEVSPGTVGLLAVKGPTGCRYLSDSRQENYVYQGWNIPGDLFEMSEDGFFFFRGRADDMIISSGYNIGSHEVEQAILSHPAVAEAAVVGIPDLDRGQIVTAFVVLQSGYKESESMITEIQNHVKSVIAPFKYPRKITFVTELPKTPTGKMQRFRLRHESSV